MALRPLGFRRLFFPPLCGLSRLVAETRGGLVRPAAGERSVVCFFCPSSIPPSPIETTCGRRRRFGSPAAGRGPGVNSEVSQGGAALKYLHTIYKRSFTPVPKLPSPAPAVSLRLGLLHLHHAPALAPQRGLQAPAERPQLLRQRLRGLG